MVVVVVMVVVGRGGWWAFAAFADLRRASHGHASTCVTYVKSAPLADFTATDAVVVVMVGDGGAGLVGGDHKARSPSRRRPHRGERVVVGGRARTVVNEWS